MHPVKADSGQTTILHAPRAAVEVRATYAKRKCTLTIVPGSICIAKANTQLVHIPEMITLVGPDGETVTDGNFYMTTTTIDPFHLVVDLTRPQ